MAINLVRFRLDGASQWGVASASGITPLEGDYPTTAALIEHGEADWRRASRRGARTQIESVELLPPVTTPCRLYCQGANYRQHMIESGMDPDAKAFNMFFTKSDASVASAWEAVAPPAHVRLLDYEVELALVFRRAITAPVKVTRDSLKDFVFALTIAMTSAPVTFSFRRCSSSKGKAIVASVRSDPG
jgi:2-keto-4-pentenoate hydratase/2-oxohepta-3-ene-1,7-dioic acid hydratase in catechol pathway